MTVKHDNKTKIREFFLRFFFKVFNNVRGEEVTVVVINGSNFRVSRSQDLFALQSKPSAPSVVRHDNVGARCLTSYFS